MLNDPRLTEEEWEMVRLVLIGGDAVESKLAAIIIRLLNEECRPEYMTINDFPNGFALGVIPMPNHCIWEEGVSGQMKGSCGGEFEFTDEKKKDEVRYCPRCGRKVERI